MTKLHARWVLHLCPKNLFDYRSQTKEQSKVWNRNDPKDKVFPSVAKSNVEILLSEDLEKNKIINRKENKEIKKT